MDPHPNRNAAVWSGHHASDRQTQRPSPYRQVETGSSHPQNAASKRDAAQLTELQPRPARNPTHSSGRGIRAVDSSWRRRCPFRSSAEDPPGLGGRRFGGDKRGLDTWLKMHDQINGKSLRIAKFQRTEHENVFITHLFYPAPPTNHLEQTVVSELPEPEPGIQGTRVAVPSEPTASQTLQRGGNRSAPSTYRR